MTMGEPGRDDGVGDGRGPRCTLLQVYLKDVSFEAPKVPGVLFGHPEPQLAFQVSINHTLSTEASAKLGEVYAVDLCVTVQATGGDTLLFLIEVHQCGLFELRGYPDDEKDHVLRTRAPELLYPHAREFISSLVGRSGFPRLLLKPINFEIRYQGYLAEHESAGTGGA